jgi:two-component system chemotaxis response regulator CheY
MTGTGPVFGLEADMTKTIMTVDDSASVRLMVNFTLKDLGYEIIEAENGNDALKKLQTKQIHMLITDINMPEMDGISLVRKVRANPDYKFIPIILLTTESQIEKKNEGKQAGATGWIVKPFKPDQLVAVVKRVLG